MRRRQGDYRHTAVGVLIVGFLLFPVYWMVLTSLRTEAEAVRTPPQLLPSGLTGSAYEAAVLDNDVILRAIGNSAIISVGTMVLTLLVAVPAAYILARRQVRGVGAIMLVLLVVQLLPAIAVATPLFVLFRRLELLNSYPGIILADATVTVPFAILVLRPFFLRVPRDLESAALVDGCRPLGAFTRVVLPVSRPGIITVAALSFLLAWGEFLFALTLTTSNDVRPLTVALTIFSSDAGTRWNLVMAVATLVAIPIVILFIALQRYIVSGLTIGGIKE